ncbi:MAG: thermonuclease family protein [Gammaproteobacteria bacterium]|nr:thermonuclease family protein [Gammaproteobacteria bacterium]
MTEIDTPERAQPWGTRAGQALAEKVFRRQVRVLSEGRDRYERLLGKIYLDGRDINREMVREGHAWAYRRYLTDQSLLDDERRAREAGAGLWSLPLAQHVPPWEWRRGERRSKTPAIASAPPTTSFACGRKTYCREMTSCAEALFYLRRCGLTRIDGDGDGVPCEKICRGSR